MPSPRCQLFEASGGLRIGQSERVPNHCAFVSIVHCDVRRTCMDSYRDAVLIKQPIGGGLGLTVSVTL